MRGDDRQQGAMFSYLSPEQRVPADHPLRPIRQMVDEVLKGLSGRFDRMYAETGRPSIAPEKLLRALTLQVLYGVHSERMLVEQLGYAISQVIRKLIETVFGDAKQHGILRQVKLRGLAKVELLFTLAATVVNLRRLPKLFAPEPSG